MYSNDDDIIISNNKTKDFVLFIFNIMLSKKLKSDVVLSVISFVSSEC